VGPGAVAEAEKLSQEEGEGERAVPAGFGGCGACRFWLVSGGLAAKEWDSLVPAYTSCSIFSEKHRSVLERGITCQVRRAVALVLWKAVICGPGFPGCFPDGRPWVLNLGAVLVCHSLSVVSSGQGSAVIVSVSRGCCGGVVLLSLCDLSTICPFRC